MAKHVNRMTQAENYCLCKFLDGIPLTASDTRASLAAAASTQLSMPVTTANVDGALKALGKHIPSAEKPLDVRLNIAISALAVLYDRLNEPMPDALKRLI